MVHANRVRKKRRTRQVSRRKVIKHRRALRAEVLEGRMMLSTASPVATFSWQTLPTGADGGQQIRYLLQEAPIVRLGPVEGGYVHGNYLGTTHGSFSDVAFAGFDSDATIADLLIQGSPRSIGSTNLYQANVDTFGTGGYAARSIVPSMPGLSSSPASQPEVSKHAGVAASSEGGLISLPVSNDSVLAKTDRDWTLRKSQFVESSNSPGTESPVRDDLAGEWARAAVFEVAGGEPVAGRLPVVDSQGETVAGTDQFPAELSESPQILKQGRYAARYTGRSFSAQSYVEQTASAGYSPASNQPVAGVLTASAIADGNSSVLPSTAETDRESTASRIAFLHPSNEKRDEAIDTAFDQLGVGDRVFPSASSDRERYPSWLSGTPLLLIFALERVTSRKARRRDATEAAVDAAQSHFLPRR